MNSTENIRFSFPRSLRELLRIQADEATRGTIVAGGTDLMAQWAAGVPAPARATSLSHVPGLDEIRIEADGTVVVGAAVTHALVRDFAPLKRHLPALAAASASVGATQIQARGTIGGNAVNASPAGDTAPALLVTGGSAVAASLGGTREIPLSAFWLAYRKTALAPGEVLVAFRLPPRRGAVETFRKIGTRRAQAISKIMAASRIRLENGRIAEAAIALGSVGPTAVRLPPVERLLLGKIPTPRLAAEAEALASASVTPIDDIRSSADYRRWAAGRLVRDILENLIKQPKTQKKRKSE